jgi:hypothetical protein
MSALFTTGVHLAQIGMIFIGKLDRWRKHCIQCSSQTQGNHGWQRKSKEIKLMRWCSQTTEGILGRHYESFDQILSRLPLFRGSRYVSNMVMTRGF